VLVLDVLISYKKSCFYTSEIKYYVAILSLTYLKDRYRK